MTTKLRPFMTVGELSRRTGVQVKASREYADWGLIYTVGRSQAGYLPGTGQEAPSISVPIARA